MVRVAALLACGGAAAIACSSFSGNDSPSTPSETSDAAAAADAPAQQVDGSKPATTPDAGDSGTTMGGMDAGTGFCLGAEHWLCDDFDRATVLTDTPYWGSLSVTGDASLDVYQPPVAAPSPPNALTAFVHGNEGANVFASYIAGSSGFRCDFDMRIDERGMAPVNLVVLSLYTANLTYYRLQIAALSDQIVEYGQLSDGGPLPVAVVGNHTWKNGEWLPIGLEVKLGPGGHIKVTTGGVDLGISSKYDLTGLQPPTSSTVQLGVSAYAGAGTWTVRYDNVVCDPLP